MIFRRKGIVKARTESFPSGLLVSTSQGEYLIQDRARLRVGSEAVKKSWSFPHTVHTEEVNLRAYPIVGKLGFRAGTVFYSLEDGLYYLVEKNKKRQIVNPAWFAWLGINRMDVTVASSKDAQLHKKGEVLD